MDDLIEALTIFRKYTSDTCINCNHDELVVCVEPRLVSKEDKQKLEELSFHVHEDFGFISYRFGSC